MSWLLLKIAADALSAGNVILGKSALSRVSDHRLYLLAVGLVSIPVAWPGVGQLLRSQSVSLTLLALCAGACYIFAGHFYYLGMKHAEPLRASLLMHASPVCTLLLSVVVLRDHLTTLQVLGFWLSFAGGLLVSKGQNRGSAAVDGAARYFLASTVMGSLASVISLIILRQYSPWETFTMTRVGVMAGLIVVLGPGGTWKTSMDFGRLRLPHMGILIGEQIIRLLSLWLGTVAVAQINSAALVAVLSGFTPIYVWIIGVLLGWEALRSLATRRYAASLALLFAGAILMVR